MLVSNKLSLIEALKSFVARANLSSAPTTSILGFLSSLLKLQGYVAMSYEELLLRHHFDYLHGKAKRTENVDMFFHENFFRQLGLSREHLDQAVTSCVNKGILEAPSSDGESSSVFCTIWKNEELDLKGALELLQ